MDKNQIVKLVEAKICLAEKIVSGDVFQEWHVYIV